MFLLTTAAFALDCGVLESKPCEAVNQAQIDVNALTGAGTIDASASVRLQPATLYDQLLDVHDEALANGCTVDGFASGTYEANVSGEGSWHDFTGDSGVLDVDLLPGKTFAGDFSGDRSGPIGDGLGSYNKQRQLLGDFEGEFILGNWVRVAGKTGAFVALRGTCPDTIPVALDPWWTGDLTGLQPQRMFVSNAWNSPENPDLWPFGGTGPLDDRCQLEADAVYGAGNTVFKAAVTDSPNGVFHPVGRFSVDRPLVQSYTGEYIADSVSQFFQLGVDVYRPVTVEADGEEFAWVEGAANSVIWFGDLDPGTAEASDCEGWTDGTLLTNVIGGQPDENDVRFYGWEAFQCSHIVSSRMYCIEDL